MIGGFDFDRHAENIDRSIKRNERWARIVGVAVAIFWLFWMAFASVSLWLLGWFFGAW